MGSFCLSRSALLLSASVDPLHKHNIPASIEIKAFPTE
jgi:hypothetical protein